MNKKIIVISFLTVLILVTISYATAVKVANTDKKESPLYRLRTSQAISEKINNIVENIKAKFKKGILSITIPKLKTVESKSKKIEITS